MIPDPNVSRGAGSILSTGNAATAINVLTGLVVLAYAISAALVGPSMYADQGVGFLALESMRHGGPFNEMLKPDPADISRDIGFFVAWWSPGQYMVPAVFEEFGLDLGNAMTVVIALFGAMGLVGLNCLYRAWGFPPLSIAVTLALVACSRLFSHQFAIYGGGEVLLFGIAPWFVLSLWRMRDFPPVQSIYLFLWIFALTLAKLSGLVFAAATVAAVELIDLRSGPPGKVRRMIFAGIPFAVFAMLFQVFWLSRGETPTTAAANVFSPEKILTHAIPSFVACFTSIVSLGDFAAAALMHPGHELLQTLVPFYLAAAIPVAALVYVAGRQIAHSHPDYFRFAATLTVIFSLVMAAVYVRGSEVSLEDRHFRQVGMVLAIGIVHAALQWRRPFALGAAAVALVLCAYGGASYVTKLRANIGHAKSDQGFRHLVLSQPALDFIRTTLDTPIEGSSLVVIPSAEIALEFRNRRTVEIAADFLKDEDIRKRLSYRGHVDSLGVLLQAKMVANGKAASVLATFKDYPADGWRETKLGDFVYFSQGQ